MYWIYKFLISAFSLSFIACNAETERATLVTVAPFHTLESVNLFIQVCLVLSEDKQTKLQCLINHHG